MTPAQDLHSEKNPPAPPELEFFDPPDKKTKTAEAGSFWRRKTVKIALALGVSLLLAVIIFFPKTGGKTKRQEPAFDEKRTLVTTASMERAIDSSARGVKVQPASRTVSRSQKEKRKLDSKIAVFVSKPEISPEPASRPRQKEKQQPLGLSSGTKIPALLSNRIFSFNVEAPVTAVVAKDFSIKDKIVIPKDSEFLGEASVVKSVDRINVRFDLLILPDGREIPVRALALSEDGTAGIRGDVDKHTDRKVLKAIGETLLAGASLFTGGRQVDPYSLEDQMRLNLAQNLTDEASRDLRSTKIETSITVDAYTQIQVILLEAV